MFGGEKSKFSQLVSVSMEMSVALCNVCTVPMPSVLYCIMCGRLLSKLERFPLYMWHAALDSHSSAVSYIYCRVVGRWECTYVCIYSTQGMYVMV